jgi:ABC-2 type transport system ATP-binding protein
VALEPIITVSDLTRRFGARTALASVSLSLPRGAVYGLVGANGVGKTTLIKHTRGPLRAETGSVRVLWPRSRGRSRRRPLAHRLRAGRIQG